jgi:hypothetical protein
MAELAQVSRDSGPRWPRSGAPRIREQLAWRARGPGIYTMNPDGTDLTQILLTNEPDPDLSWRPRCNIRGTRGGDTLSGTIARELICGYAGNDIVYASRPMTPSSPVRAMIGCTAGGGGTCSPAGPEAPGWSAAREGIS